MSIYRIESIEHLNNSVNGNPRYRFGLTEITRAGDGWPFTAILSSDASFGYEVGNPGYRVGSTVRVEFTRAGRVRWMSAVESTTDQERD